MTALHWIRDNGDELETANGFVNGRTYYARISVGSRSAVSVHHMFPGSIRGTITYQASNVDDPSAAFLVAATSTGRWVEQSGLSGDSPDGTAKGSVDPLYDLGGVQLRATFVCSADGTMTSTAEEKA